MMNNVGQYRYVAVVCLPLHCRQNVVSLLLQTFLAHLPSTVRQGLDTQC